MKKCSKCEEIFPIEQFRKDSSKKDGRRGYCAKCHKETNAAWASKNRDRVNVSRKKWANNNQDKIIQMQINYAGKAREKASKWYRENKEKAAEKRKAYQQNNKERLRKKSAEWRQKNIEKLRAYHAEYWKRDLERTLARNAARRARKKNAPGTYTASEIVALRKLQRGKCAICHITLGLVFHRDHIVPLHLGGANDIKNIQLLCVSCNCSKGAKDPIEHAQQNGRLL